MNAAFCPKIELSWHLLGPFGHLCSSIFCRHSQWWIFSELFLGATYYTLCFSGALLLSSMIEDRFYLSKIMKGLTLNLVNGNSCRFSSIHKISGRDSLCHLFFQMRKLRSIEVKWLVQGPTAGDWRDWDDRLVSSLLASADSIICDYKTTLTSGRVNKGTHCTIASLSNESLANWSSCFM